MSQVYGVYTIRGSLLMYLGIAIFSPSAYSGIYIGVWSYSALLTAGATVYFTQPSLRSLPLHILAIGSTVAVHACVAPILQQFRLPAFTIPFVVTSWAFLLFSTGNGVVVRSANPLTPEQRIMAMREKSQMALAHIVKLTAGVAAGVERVGPAVLKEVKVGDTSTLHKVNNTADRMTEQINQNRDIHQETFSQPCPTCPRGGHRSGESCRGLEARGCFTCGLAGHFKGAPVCPGPGDLDL